MGAGPLEPLLRDPSVTDVLVNGPRDVWVDRGAGLERETVAFASEVDVRRLAQRLASQAGRRLDVSSPCVDARLPDGARLHCVLPPIATSGTLISLRVPRRTTFTLDDLSKGQLTIIASKADCVLFAPLVTDLDTVCRLLASGKNVVSPAGPFLPNKWIPDDAARIDAACKEGNSSFHGCGIHPGFSGDILPITLSRLMNRSKGLSPLGSVGPGKL